METKMFDRGGKKFFSIGGQVNNSSSQSEECLERAVQAITKFEMNTIAAPICWYQTEPEEGVFDFGQIDLVLRKARENGLKVVFLWFGTWKNGASHYVPGWVKEDKKRFIWAQNAVGAPTRSLSPVGMETGAFGDTKGLRPRVGYGVSGASAGGYAGISSKIRRGGDFFPVEGCGRRSGRILERGFRALCGGNFFCLLFC